MEIRKPKIGLFAGGNECYWVDMSMDELPARLQQDVARLIASLDGDVVFGGVGFIAAFPPAGGEDARGVLPGHHPEIVILREDHGLAVR